MATAGWQKQCKNLANQTLKFTKLLQLLIQPTQWRQSSHEENLQQPFPSFAAGLSGFPCFLRITLASTEALFSKHRAPEGEVGGATSQWKPRERLLQVSVPIMGGSVLLGESSGRGPTTVLCEQEPGRGPAGTLSLAPCSPLHCCSGHLSSPHQSSQ